MWRDFEGPAPPTAAQRPTAGLRRLVYTLGLRAMKLNLATRLFAAVLSTAVVVAVAMGVGAHVNLNRDFLGYLNEQAVNRLDLAVPSVTAGYRQHGSWDFLQQRPDLWFRLLRPLPDDGRVPWPSARRRRRPHRPS